MQASDAQHPIGQCAKDETARSQGQIPREWYGTSSVPDVIPAIEPPRAFVSAPPAPVTPALAEPAGSASKLDYPPPDVASSVAPAAIDPATLEHAPGGASAMPDVIPALFEIHVSTGRAHSLLAIDAQQRPYKVNVPDKYVRCGAEYVSQIEICVNERGTVASVKILRPSIPVIDLQIPQVIARWTYRPYRVDARPTAFCYVLNYHVR